MMHYPDSIHEFMDKIKPQHFIDSTLSKLYVYIQNNYSNSDSSLSSWIQVELNKKEKDTYNRILKYAQTIEGKWLLDMSTCYTIGLRLPQI
jgi:hypothetical protein